MRHPALFAFMVGTCLLNAPAWAQSLKIALSSEPTAIDPHYHDLTPNNALHRMAAAQPLDNSGVTEGRHR